MSWLSDRITVFIRRVLPERQRLARIWAMYPAGLLDRYLVTGYQNPRINVASILVRHALIRRLFGSDDPQLEELMDAEVRFAVDLNEVLRRRAAELHVRMGSYVNPLKQARVARVDRAIAGRQREYERRWAATLRSRDARPLRVLEIACGSANDYRSWVATGIARFLDYSGIDLNPRNVANARRRFPAVDFRVADLLDLPFPDALFDIVVGSEIFEHLSLEALGVALAEVRRVGRDELIFAFFDMTDDPADVERTFGLYQRNLLSQARFAERLEPDFATVSAIRVTRMLRERYAYGHSYNPRSWVVVAQREPVGP